MGNVVVAVNDDVRKTLNGTFQVRLSSLESCKKFLVRIVVTALAHAHRDSLDCFFGTIDLDEDENNGVPKSCVR